MFKPKKSVILAAILAAVVSMGNFSEVSAAVDTRIKATASLTMYDMSRVMANGYFDYDKDAETLAAERQSNR